LVFIRVGHNRAIPDDEFTEIVKFDNGRHIGKGSYTLTLTHGTERLRETITIE
jgi:hypothetical protein